MKLTKEQEIINLLFKNKNQFYNSRNISKLIGISHPGAFKILKKLEKNLIVNPKKIGNSIIYSLNFENPLTKNLVENALISQSQKFNKWIMEFKELEEKSIFIILFGSIIRNEEQANDIDLYILSNRSDHNFINEFVKKKNKILNKKVHLILQSENDFLKDLLENNKVILEILRTGIVLFGQDKLINLAKNERY